MKLRKLELKDAPKMYAWMHDKSVVEYMGTDFSKKTIEDCVAFIKSAQRTSNHIHRAIVDEKDEYMGTVSLKNIDKNNMSAEFAITVGKDAMGKGFSQYAMSSIIKYGFQELKLKSIYWYVDERNERAIRFYKKCGYDIMEQSRLNELNNSSDGKEKFIWFEVKNK